MDEMWWGAVGLSLFFKYVIKTHLMMMGFSGACQEES